MRINGLSEVGADLVDEMKDVLPLDDFDEVDAIFSLGLEKAIQLLRVCFGRSP